MRVTPLYAKVPARDITNRIIRNPNYGGPVLTYQGWRSQPVTPATRKVKFFEALEKDIAENGYRNPAIAWSVIEGLHIQFGVSRLRVGQLLDIEIPCIINSVDGSYEHGVEVTKDNWTTFFTDVPEYYVFNKDGSFDYHYSLERNRRHSYDPAGMAWAGDTFETFRDEFSWIDAQNQK